MQGTQQQLVLQGAAAACQCLTLCDQDTLRGYNTAPLRIPQPHAGTHLFAAFSCLTRGLGRGRRGGGGQGLGGHKGLVCGDAQLLQGVRKEADLAVALLAVIAQLRPVASGVQPVFKNIVCVGAGIAAQTALVLQRNKRDMR